MILEKHRLTPAPLLPLTILLMTGVAYIQPTHLSAQAPGVTIVRDRGEAFEALIKQAVEIKAKDGLLSREEVERQLSRSSADIKLPRPATSKLSDREIAQRSQQAHVRIGWHYLCTKCDKWHQNLAGGYFITADGAIATCYHVIKPKKDHREAYLVAADAQGRLLPVTEVLAADEQNDAAIVQAKLPTAIKPLPLNTNVYPGDAAWCFSDPLGRSGYFSKGMVNRFYYQNRKGGESVRMEVSTDWAPGSSGSAVLDECGNTIGHVSEISPAGLPRSRSTNQPAASASGASMIVFHSAVPAADILSLVKPAKKK
jgi:hypothetical protein